MYIKCNVTAPNYTQYYAEKLQAGEEYQQFIYDLFLVELRIELTFYTTKLEQYKFGENEQGIEVKFDDRLKGTDNLYIEYAEKSHPDKKEYSPSGINRDDNSWLYVIGDRDDVFIFGKKQLQQIKPSKRHVVTATSKGFLIEREDAHKLCLKHLCPEKRH